MEVINLSLYGGNKKIFPNKKVLIFQKKFKKFYQKKFLEG